MQPYYFQFSHSPGRSHVGTVHEADMNNIWTVELDADDLPSVVRYGFARGG